MSKTITSANLASNAEATYKVDDFRSMVNYANPKNKGYVRFTMNGDGKLSIQKFNNKLDVPLSWRSNVSVEHNRALREQFLKAIEKDLAYMGNADKIRDMILRPVNKDENVNTGMALSRRELKKIFEKFDAEFNTGTGASG